MHNQIGLGTFPLAGVFNEITREKAQQVIREFVEQGGYYIDTAPLYGFGEVEAIIAEALQGIPREKYFLISKCGYIDVEGKDFSTVKKSGKYKDVIRTCEDSLKRLGVDYLDLYLMHSPDPNVPAAETLSALIDLKKFGKVKQIGVSNVNLAELREYNKTGDIAYIQNNFSFINRSIDQELADYMLENQIKLIPYHVLEIGQFSNENIQGDLQIQNTDLRSKVKYWKPEIKSLIDNWLQTEILPIATMEELSVQSLMMAWALEQPIIEFIIVGTTKPQRIKSNLQVNEIKLSVETIARLENSYQTLIATIKDNTGKSIKEFRELNEKYY